MVLFNDKSGLKVISVGFLLGMVSCLQGMPNCHFSLTVQGDKVILMYTGEVSDITASAFPFFEGREISDDQILVIENTGYADKGPTTSILFKLCQQVGSFDGSNLGRLTSLSNDKPNQQTQHSFNPNALGCSLVGGVRGFVFASVPFWYSYLPSHLHSDCCLAHSTRAGPIC